MVLDDTSSDTSRSVLCFLEITDTIHTSSLFVLRRLVQPTHPLMIERTTLCCVRVSTEPYLVYLLLQVSAAESFASKRKRIAWPLFQDCMGQTGQGRWGEPLMRGEGSGEPHDKQNPPPAENFSPRQGPAEVLVKKGIGQPQLHTMR